MKNLNTFFFLNSAAVNKTLASIQISSVPTVIVELSLVFMKLFLFNFIYTLLMTSVSIQHFPPKYNIYQRFDYV